MARMNQAPDPKLPAGRYLHGSRRIYKPGETLLTGVVNNIPGEEDDRQMCFATTSLDDALHWAYSRGIRYGGETLYVYEVEMVDAEPDVNMHGPDPTGPYTSVMSSKGTVVRLFHQVPLADYPHAHFGRI